MSEGFYKTEQMHSWFSFHCGGTCLSACFLMGSYAITCIVVFVLTIHNSILINFLLLGKMVRRKIIQLANTVAISDYKSVQIFLANTFASWFNKPCLVAIIPSLITMYAFQSISHHLTMEITVKQELAALISDPFLICGSLLKEKSLLP